MTRCGGDECVCERSGSERWGKGEVQREAGRGPFLRTCAPPGEDPPTVPPRRCHMPEGSAGARAGGGGGMGRSKRRETESWQAELLPPEPHTHTHVHPHAPPTCVMRVYRYVYDSHLLASRTFVTCSSQAQGPATLPLAHHRNHNHHFHHHLCLPLAPPPSLPPCPPSPCPAQSRHSGGPPVPQ